MNNELNKEQKEKIKAQFLLLHPDMNDTDIHISIRLSWKGNIIVDCFFDIDDWDRFNFTKTFNMGKLSESV